MGVEFDKLAIFSLSLSQHPFVTEFNERVVRIQMKDQIDIMKRKKISPSEQYSSGEGEGDSLDPPTIKKPGGKRNKDYVCHLE